MVYNDYRYLTEDDDDRTVFGSNSQNGRLVYDAEDSSVDFDEIEYPIEKTWDELTEDQQEQAIEWEARHDDWTLWNDRMDEDFEYLLEEWNSEYDFNFDTKDFPFDDRYGRPLPEYSLSMFDTEIDVDLPRDKAFDEHWIAVEVEFDGSYSYEAKEATYDIREVIKEMTEQLAEYEFEPDDPSKDEVEDMIDIVTAELSRKCRDYINRVAEYLEKIEDFIGEWADGPNADYYRGYLECNDYKFLIDEDGNLESIEY